MNSKEFVIWVKGFVAGSNNFNLTPAGWQELKDRLAEVKDDEPNKLIKDYVNPYGGRYTTTSTAPYTTGGQDEVIKKEENEN
jgi:hypothetical protein